MLTIALLVTGYAGYYLCRSDLSVAMPLLIRRTPVAAAEISDSARARNCSIRFLMPP